jgi:hypothetical protein
VALVWGGREVRTAPEFEAVLELVQRAERELGRR